VNRRLLKLLSRILELPDDYLWGLFSIPTFLSPVLSITNTTNIPCHLLDTIQSHESVVGDGYFRHALFYPLSPENRETMKGVRMYGYVLLRPFLTLPLKFLISPLVSTQDLPAKAFVIYQAYGLWNHNSTIQRTHHSPPDLGPGQKVEVCEI
jgi:hypothetical protein